MSAPRGPKAGRWPIRGIGWLADRRAAMTVLFTLTVLPVLGFVALAFDVGSTVWARSQLDLAADASALSAVIKGANDFAANSGTSLLPAQSIGVKRFNAQANRLPGVNLASLNVAVTRNGGTITATVAYKATFTTRFAGIFGFPTLPAAGTAAISRTNSPFFAIDIMMDASSSMAIAATPAAMAQLGQLVRASSLYVARGQGQNCAFGCHFDANNNDFYGLAQSNGIPLRINVLIQAVQNVVNTLAASPSAPQFAIGLYSFNATFNTVFAPSTDLTAAAAAAGAMTVPVTSDGGTADTNIPLALQSITSLMPAGGDGSSASSPRRFLFIVTDGVADYFNGQGARTIQALDPTQCAALKSNGVIIMTLYTQYFPLIPPNEVPAPGNAFYITNVAPFVNNLQPNLQACASSASYAFLASDATSIGVALQAMLASAINSPAHFVR